MINLLPPAQVEIPNTKIRSFKNLKRVRQGTFLTKLGWTVFAKPPFRSWIIFDPPPFQNSAGASCQRE
jgi:hypothetical protein